MNELKEVSKMVHHIKETMLRNKATILQMDALKR